MNVDPNGKIVSVVGATGLQGSAVCKRLHGHGWTVRGLSRDPTSKKARSLLEQGIDLLKGDLDRVEDIERVFEGAWGVFVVLDPMAHGSDRERLWGEQVVDAAKRAGVRHFVYSSVGSAGCGNGVGHFASKAEVERHLNDSGIPATILRPTSFMEDLTEKKFVPPVLWHVWTKVSGPDTKLQWVAIDDIAAATAAVFADPERAVGRTITLVADERSLAECRDLFESAHGRAPRRLPMPPALFRRLVSQDLHRLFEWYAEGGFRGEPSELLEWVPRPLDMATWLKTRVAG